MALTGSDGSPEKLVHEAERLLWEEINHQQEDKFVPSLSESSSNSDLHSKHPVFIPLTDCFSVFKSQTEGLSVEAEHKGSTGKAVDQNEIGIHSFLVSKHLSWHISGLSDADVR